MSITYRAQSTQNTAATNTITVNYPTGTANGDIVFAWVTRLALNGANATITTASNNSWNHLLTAAAPTAETMFTLYWQIYNSGVEGSTFTFNFTNSYDTSVRAISFSRSGNEEPQTLMHHTDNALGAVAIPGMVHPTTADWLFFMETDGTATPAVVGVTVPSGWTEITDAVVQYNSTAANAEWQWLGQKTTASTSSTATEYVEETITMTGDTKSQWALVCVAEPVSGDNQVSGKSFSADVALTGSSPQALTTAHYPTYNPIDGYLYILDGPTATSYRLYRSTDNGDTWDQLTGTFGTSVVWDSIAIAQDDTAIIRGFTSPTGYPYYAAFENVSTLTGSANTPDAVTQLAQGSSASGFNRQSWRFENIAWEESGKVFAILPFGHYNGTASYNMFFPVTKYVKSTNTFSSNSDQSLATVSSTQTWSGAPNQKWGVTMEHNGDGYTPVTDPYILARYPTESSLSAANNRGYEGWALYSWTSATETFTLVANDRLPGGSFDAGSVFDGIYNTMTWTWNPDGVFEGFGYNGIIGEDSNQYSLATFGEGTGATMHSATNDTNFDEGACLMRVTINPTQSGNTLKGMAWYSLGQMWWDTSTTNSAFGYAGGSSNTGFYVTSYGQWIANHTAYVASGYNAVDDTYVSSPGGFMNASHTFTESVDDYADGPTHWSLPAAVAVRSVGPLNAMCYAAERPLVLWSQSPSSFYWYFGSLVPPAGGAPSAWGVWGT